MDTHRQQRLFVTLGLVVLVATAGCSAAAVSTDAPPPASRQARARYHDGELAFTYPTSWKPHKYEVVSSFSKAIVYLSNQPFTSRAPATAARAA